MNLNQPTPSSCVLLAVIRVMLHETKGDKFQIAFDCLALDADDAALRAEQAYPGCEVLSATKLEDDADGYVIYSPNEAALSDSAGFWNNDFGWVPLEQATLFTAEESQKLNLPISTGGDANWIIWSKLQEAYAAETELRQAGIDTLAPAIDHVVTDTSLNALPHGDWLFIGVYPCGLQYCDRSRLVDGDYAKLAFLPYDTLELAFRADCPESLKPSIVADAARMKARRGQKFEISAVGQTVTLGVKANSEQALA